MKPKDDVPVEYLRELFEYDPESGLLTHKGRLNVRKTKFDGRIRSGMVAGYVTSIGYLVVKIHSRAYCTHRVIWAMVTGSWPKYQIDHVNLIKTDNRWINLREATISQNKANIRSQRVGLKGAYKGSKNRWRSSVGGIHLG